jgi:hypothetical protein
LERRWNEKLEETEAVKQRLSTNEHSQGEQQRIQGPGRQLSALSQKFNPFVRSSGDSAKPQASPNSPNTRREAVNMLPEKVRGEILGSPPWTRFELWYSLPALSNCPHAPVEPSISH